MNIYVCLHMAKDIVCSCAFTAHNFHILTDSCFCNTTVLALLRLPSDCVSFIAKSNLIFFITRVYFLLNNSI